MYLPGYDLHKIKFATDIPTFEKAVGLYESGKVSQVEEGVNSYSAVVLGTKPYRVSIDARRFAYGRCSCYVGEHDGLCKHMVALSLAIVKAGKPLTEEDKKLVSNPECSNRVGILSKEELSRTKKAITTAVRYIKPYTGPSRTWFTYQDSLEEGCRRLSAVIADLPVGLQTATVLVDLLLQLDKKLSAGGVDDSNGIVGGFIEDVVGVLEKYIAIDASCKTAFTILKNKDTSFDWEEPLLALAGT